VREKFKTTQQPPKHGRVTKTDAELKKMKVHSHSIGYGEDKGKGSRAVNESLSRDSIAKGRWELLMEHGNVVAIQQVGNTLALCLSSGIVQLWDVTMVPVHFESLPAPKFQFWNIRPSEWHCSCLAVSDQCAFVTGIFSSTRSMGKRALNKHRIMVTWHVASRAIVSILRLPFASSGLEFISSRSHVKDGDGGDDTTGPFLITCADSIGVFFLIDARDGSMQNVTPSLTAAPSPTSTCNLNDQSSGKIYKVYACSVSLCVFCLFVLRLQLIIAIDEVFIVF
jgi:hypothetical protein